MNVKVTEGVNALLREKLALSEPSEIESVVSELVDQYHARRRGAKSMAMRVNGQQVIYVHDARRWRDPPLLGIRADRDGRPRMGSGSPVAEG
jgi:hypothetical protein